MRKSLFLIAWIITWRAEWDVLRFCPGYYDEIRGENRPESERLYCKESVFNWRHKEFQQFDELLEFRKNELMSSTGTVITNISVRKVKD
jgi:hypothetical protein